MKKLQIALLSLLSLTTACTNNLDENITDYTAKAVIVEASIGKVQEGRATANADGISYKSFADGDNIGLFAQGGLIANNTKLTKDGTFKNEELNWMGGNATNVYAYFPYSDDKDTGVDGTQIKIWKDAGAFDDILTANTNKAAEGTIINMTFNHRFAMLIVKRGKGFKNVTNPTDKSVQVSLNQSVSEKASINYPVSSGKDFIALQKDEANGHKSLGTSSIGKDYYVIIPVGIVDEGPNAKAVNVESIILYNDLNRQMTVPYSISKLESGKKYTVTVMMRDNNAVVSPTKIIQWDKEEVNITKPAGIENIDQFLEWEATYNTSPRRDTENNILAKYGSYENSHWTFRLLADIDFSLASGKEFNGITTFTDTFDGQGHTITGINIQEKEATGSNPTGFVRTLANTGKIERLILKDAIIYGTENVGAFAGTTETGGVIENCKLTGASIIFGTNNVGAFAGNGSATITNCSSTPTVIVKTSN